MIDPKNLREVCEILRTYGVSYLKSNDLELKIDSSSLVPSHTREPDGQKQPDSEDDKKIKDKVDEFKSVMALGDEELINRMFPATNEVTE
jgi:hypothetical protein